MRAHVAAVALLTSFVFVSCSKKGDHAAEDDWNRQAPYDPENANK